MERKMFCFQCEQTAACTGCTGKAGVCGKTADVAQLQDELTGAKTAIKILGGNLEKTEKFQLADTDMERSFVVIRKTKPTGKKFPRKAGLPSKEPIK